MRNAPFLNLVLTIALVLMAGWLLVVGQSIILPIVTAVIVVYVLTTASEMMGRQPVLRQCPDYLRHLIVLLVFTAVLIGFVLVIQVTVGQIRSELPRYQANLQALIDRLADLGWIEDNPTLDDIVEVTLRRINLQSLFRSFLGGVTGFSLNFFLVALYAAFLLSERQSFQQKLKAALPAGDQARITAGIIEQMNAQIGNYLAAKTLVNAILGTVSYVMMWAMGVDFALFWALLIALFNYIPYLGGPMGVAPPVILSLAQWGAPLGTVVLCALLASAQAVIGTILDPTLVGRRVNLSPFMVLVALAVWGALWGLPGAILAVPMTAIIAIVCAAFDETRFIALLLAEKVRPEDQPGPGGPESRCDP